ncbi:ferrochelatase [Lysobacter sp. CA199]|uniref:ferrochelatase n=1 Tax=Lysobacter sp. CA199 TaxID=3455608 RepID=UPI003F8D5ED3
MRMPASASIAPVSPRPTADTAVVLVNLGTPEAPNTAAVRRYLSEFLHDRRVVDMNRWLWCPLLHFAILPLRSGKVAHKYASIWLPEGSPLAVHTRRLAQALQRELPQHRVLHAMRYGAPSWKQLLEQLREQGVRRVIALPLYPQYSTSTTASVGDVLARAEGLDTRMVHDYHLDPDWVAAIADSVRRHRHANGAGQHLLFSFHGLPQRFAAAGDPYPRQCEASVRAIAQALELPEDAWTLTYQSRFGRERWLEPATADTLTALAARGVRQVDVVAPGFAVDCLETLEEVAMMLAEDFAARGGQLRYVPCLNESPAHVAALAGIVQRELAAWN